jgi:hypothetical protein
MWKNCVTEAEPWEPWKEFGKLQDSSGTLDKRTDLRGTMKKGGGTLISKVESWKWTCPKRQSTYFLTIFTFHRGNNPVNPVNNQVRHENHEEVMPDLEPWKGGGMSPGRKYLFRRRWSGGNNFLISCYYQPRYTASQLSQVVFVSSFPRLTPETAFRFNTNDWMTGQSL